MDDATFWKFMGFVDHKLVDQGHDQAGVESLTSALARLPIQEIESFEEVLAHKLFALDGQAYADHAGQSGQSGDGFLYIRCYVVSRGESFYREVLVNPERHRTTSSSGARPSST
jgi:hypothetical protein